MRTLAASWLTLHGAMALCTPTSSAVAEIAQGGGTNSGSARADSLIITGEFHDLPAGEGGGGGAVAWVRSFSNGSALTAGVAAYSVSESRWTLARLGGAYRPAGQVTFYGQLSAGPGRESGSDFTYLIVDGGLSRQLVPGLTLRLEDRQIEVGRTHGNLPKLGLNVVVRPDLLADLSYAQSVSGNLNTQLLSGRLDYHTRYAAFLGGLARGHSTPELFDVRVGDLTRAGDLKELFLGITVPARSADISIIFDLLDLENTQRRTWTISVKWPLGAPPQP